MALKPRADITRSPKQGVSVTLEKGHMFSKILKKFSQMPIVKPLLEFLDIAVCQGLLMFL